MVIAAPLIGQDLAGDPGIGALLLTAMAAGALAGSAVVARRPIRRRGPGTTVVLSTLTLGLCMTALAAVPSMPIAFVVVAVLGFLQAPQLTAVMQVRDRESPEQVRSLVFVAAASLKTGAFAVGAVLAATLVDLGWRPLLLAGALVEVAAVIMGLLLAGRRAPA